jgi:outer membrane protein assembly factor BamD
MNIFQIERPDSKYHDDVARMIDDLNDRLELKAYKSAWLYYHMEDYQAAHYALKNVLKDNADNRYREDILYYTAMSAYKYAFNSVASKQRERYLVFVDDYFNLISEYPDSKYVKELEGLYKKTQKYLKQDNQDG